MSIGRYIMYILRSLSLINVNSWFRNQTNVKRLFSNPLLNFVKFIFDTYWYV